MMAAGCTYLPVVWTSVAALYKCRDGTRVHTKASQQYIGDICGMWICVERGLCNVDIILLASPTSCTTDTLIMRRRIARIKVAEHRCPAGCGHERTYVHIWTYVDITSEFEVTSSDLPEA